MGGRARGWFGSYAAALSSRDLRLMLTALFISSSGTWAYNVALLAFVFERTHSLGWVGVAGLARYVPALVLSPYGGVLAERVERIGLVRAADLGCALWQGAMAAVAALAGPVWLALLFAALTAATSVVFDPAVAATIPAVVDEDELVAANALNGTIDNVVVVVGPAIGAALLVLGSPTWVFAVNGATFIVSALLFSRVRTRSTPVELDIEQTGIGEQLMVGVREIAAQPAARVLVAFSVLVSFIYGSDTILFVGVAQQKLGLGADGFGYLLAGLGAGGILAAGAVDRLASSARLAPLIIAGVAVDTLPTALLIVVHSPAIAVAIQVVRGGASLVVDVLAITSLQRSVPGDRLARVFGVFFAFVLGAIALGVIVTPALVHGFGLDGALAIMALAPFAVGVAGFPALARVDERAAAETARLLPRVQLLERLEIFRTARRPVLERLAADASERTVPEGTAVVREGETADALFVLVAGSVRVTAHGEAGGPERELRVMNAPTYFGEIGVLERIARTATVTTLGPCTMLRIDADPLLDALTSTPPSSSLMENARSRLVVTHPSHEPTFVAADTP
ncbi:MAG TPA: MFS transporter [Solirubrobacteraceae bacterium]|nr:MFS transporter [Solirubrobacteraceae bacterium]